MSRYTMVHSDIWADEKVLELSQIGKLLYMYLLSSPYGNIAGFYRINPRQIAFDMGLPEKEILPELLGQKKLWKYDDKTKQVFIPNFFKYNKLFNEKQFKAIDNQILPLSLCELHKPFLFSMQKYLGDKSLKYINKETRVYVREQCRGQDTPIDITLYRLLSNTNT